MKKINTILKINKGIENDIDKLENMKEPLKFGTKVKFPKDSPWTDCDIEIDGHQDDDTGEYLFDIYVSESQDRNSDIIEGLTILELTKLRDLLNKIL